MSELRTLKDLYGVYPNENDNKHIDEAELKAEAVKRVKVWQIQKEMCRKIGNEAGVNCVEQIQNEYIDFFNLTEADLLVPKENNGVGTKEEDLK